MQTLLQRLEIQERLRKDRHALLCCIEGELAQVTAAHLGDAIAQLGPTTGTTLAATQIIGDDGRRDVKSLCDLMSGSGSSSCIDSGIGGHDALFARIEAEAWHLNGVLHTHRAAREARRLAVRMEKAVYMRSTAMMPTAARGAQAGSLATTAIGRNGANTGVGACTGPDDEGGLGRQGKNGTIAAVLGRRLSQKMRPNPGSLGLVERPLSHDYDSDFLAGLTFDESGGGGVIANGSLGGGAAAAAAAAIAVVAARGNKDLDLPTFLSISVQQPSSSGGGLFAHTVYTCNARLLRGPCEALRRYREFESLRLAVIRRFPELRSKVLPLPPKKFVGKMKQAVTDQRRAGLEAFLCSLMALQQREPLVGKFLERFFTL